MKPFFESEPDHYCRLFAPSKLSDPDRRDALTDLGAAMLDMGEPDGSLLDAGYTYFGQFIDHDLTMMDPLPPPFWRKILRALVHWKTRHWIVNVKDELKNLQSPRLDLSHLYGGGPSDQNYGKLYQPDGVRLKVGPRSGSGRSFDVYVDPTHGTPVLADGRSTENLIIRQMVAFFARLHNAAVDQWKSAIKDSTELFEQARKQTVWQFQYLVVQDYLRKILDRSVFDKVFVQGKPSFDWKTTFSIPVEFAVAAFRFGHSMVRLNYLFSMGTDPKDFRLDEILARALKSGHLEDDWEIKWGCFFQGAEQTDNSGQSDSRLVHAQAIDTLIAKQLHDLANLLIQLFPVSKLPLPVIAVDEFRLPVRTLLRGESMRLCSGQIAADAFEVDRLTESELMSVRNGTPPEAPHKPVLERAQLLEYTPLWYYILKESEIAWDGNRLGPVGSHIVAETISAVLRYDRGSYFFNPDILGSREWRTRNRLLLSSPPMWRIGGNELRIFSLAELFSHAPELPSD